ncbi:RNA polymerase sigma factor (sigma-70 family) [Anseongella ginsenosidimutans]|uniref:RNA polymerase sigma factor (Sigma-70 family) n=1 Tax=Anseongella ginsenosidimutans TaxID=496056 RepID=A0A4R3KWY6_9SPHI|nr:sigma-70 family RNA polymerase sigma factor [Anseongella ginsenosidimutans]QEC51880.1 sigma-70 family RNA polymerase sigma factor [Anseongella ginsenosidimutans]TCS89266.1 RNA polymerase sigma factor (sigma-70 family) [Anseongella ginsenosidimutans]
MRSASAFSREEAAKLWNQFRAGKGDALGELISHYYHDLYAYGIRFTANAELLKDCIQEICLDLWKNRSTISETGYVKFYLLKSLRRRLIRELQKKKPEPLDEGTLFYAGYDRELPRESHIIRDEQLTALALKMRELLNQLSRRQQEVIYLRFYMDADINEIAAIMSVSKQSVYNHLHDALKRLKALAGSLHMVVFLLLLRSYH